MKQRTSTLKFLVVRLGIFLLAVAIAYLLATASATSSVIASLQGMGIDVPLSVRATMTLRDLAGMASMFLPMVAFALLVAFMTAALLSRWLRRGRMLLYALAGGVGLVTIHLMLHFAFGITPIAIARTGVGLLVQGAAGGLAGVAYLHLTRRTQIARQRAPDPSTGPIRKPVQ
jgi:hypothetical protein